MTMEEYIEEVKTLVLANNKEMIEFAYNGEYKDLKELESVLDVMTRRLLNKVHELGEQVKTPTIEELKEELGI